MIKKILILVIFFSFHCALANVVGNGHQNFNPTPSGVDFVTVHSSETLEPGIVNVGLFFNYAVNTLPYYVSISQERTKFNDTLLGMDLSFGIGLGTNWDFGFSLPFVITQSVGNDTTYHGQFTKTGMTEIRLLTKYRFYGDSNHGLAFVLSTNINRTKNNPYIGTNTDGQIINYELAGDWTLRRWALGANVGYRQMDPGGQVPGALSEPLEDQIIASLAGSYLLEKVDTKLILEVFGSQPAKSQSSNPRRSASSLEFLAGVKYDHTHNLALHFGGGTELLHGVSSPDWRAYSGLNYSFGPVFKGRPKNERSDDRLIARDLLFEFDSDKMIESVEENVRDIVIWIRQHKYRKLRIEGHTDSIGPVEYNQSLSEKRALAIRQLLINKFSFSPDVIEAVGRGESQPVSDNGNFQGRQLNRRVEFILDK